MEGGVDLIPEVEVEVEVESIVEGEGEAVLMGAALVPAFPEVELAFTGGANLRSRRLPTLVAAEAVGIEAMIGSGD